MAADLDASMEELKKAVDNLCNSVPVHSFGFSSAFANGFANGMLGNPNQLGPNAQNAYNQQLARMGQWSGSTGISGQQWNAAMGYPGSIASYQQKPPKNDVAEALQWAEEKYAYDDKIVELHRKLDHYTKENSILKRRIERMSSSWIPPRMKRLYTQAMGLVFQRR